MDEVIKIHRVIRSGSLKIDQLKKYIGREADVTIHIRSKEGLADKSAEGLLKKYAKGGKQAHEKEAWSLAIKEKYDHC